MLDADDVPDPRRPSRRRARAARSAHPPRLREARAARRAAERAVVLGRVEAEGPGEVDLVLPVRDPRRVQPLHRRLDSAVPRERPARHGADRAGRPSSSRSHPRCSRCTPTAARRSAPSQWRSSWPISASRKHTVRPYTSSDNPYSESNFKTLKYRPEFPARFDDIEHARAHCRAFVDWYNHAHRHSGIGLMTPSRRPPRTRRPRCTPRAASCSTPPTSAIPSGSSADRPSRPSSRPPRGSTSPTRRRSLTKSNREASHRA